MNDTSKNSSSKKQQSNNLDIYIYILLVILIGIIIFLVVYYFFISKKSSELTLEQIRKDVNSEVDKLDEKGLENNTKPLEILKNEKANRVRAKFLEKEIKAKNNKKLLTVLEEVRKELKELRDLEEVKKLKSVNFKEVSEEKREELAQKNEEKRIKLSRISSHLFNFTNEEIIKRYEKEQPEWENNFDPSDPEITQRLKKFTKNIYNKFYNNYLTQEVKEKYPIKNVRPLLADGKEIDPFRRHEYIERVFSRSYDIFRDKVTKEKIEVKPIKKVDFKGFVDFIKPEDEAQKTEGWNTMGFCRRSSGNYRIEDWVGNDFLFWPEPDPLIKLEKRIFFSREPFPNNEEWITNIEYKEDGSISWKFLSIGEWKLIDTIAHEIAHAVIEVVYPCYYGEYDGDDGHGILHLNWTREIRKMMKKMNEYNEFITWWREKLSPKKEPSKNDQN